MAERPPSLRPERLLAQRGAGVLLHLTSLPGPGPQGTLGPPAFRFIDFLADAGFDTWSMLPLGPVDASRSPYHTLSLVAGDPALVPAPLPSRPPSEYAPYDFEHFCEAERGWLDDFALFMALRTRHGGTSWVEWPQSVRDREPAALAAATRELADDIERHVHAQFAFNRHWAQLREHAHRKGVRLFGDMPFYPSYDSAEVWARRELFALDDDGSPRFVGGVPPDAFAADGQRWGNPVYAWDTAADALVEWWAQRLRTEGGRFDLMRIDHFRGLDAYWAVPADASTAVAGAWRPAPGRRVLERFATVDGRPELIAEDLGTITPEVHALRDAFALPGMRVLQFAFDGHADNPHLPANHAVESVVYTGTHDNDTALGWWASLDGHARDRALDAMAPMDESMPWPLVELALHSPAALAVLPMQDCLALGSGARMNVPGTASGNWTWRMDADAASPALAEALAARLARAARVSAS